MQGGLLVVAFDVIAACGWVISEYIASRERQARAAFGRRLAEVIAPDYAAKYFTPALSPEEIKAFNEATWPD